MGSEMCIRDRFSKYWAPHIIAEMNDHQFKLVKIKGEFIWHEHKNSDETFIVVEGNMEIKFNDKIVNLSQGEMFVVKKMVVYRKQRCFCQNYIVARGRR